MVLGFGYLLLGFNSFACFGGRANPTRANQQPYITDRIVSLKLHFLLAPFPLKNQVACRLISAMAVGFRINLN